MTDSITKAAQTYWNTDTTGSGHLKRGKAFAAAQSALVDQGLTKTEARKHIAEEVTKAAPPHSKKFGAATISHYVASINLISEHAEGWVDALRGDLYAIVHKAYAGSIGAEKIAKALIDSETPEDAAEAVAGLKRDSKAGDEGDKPTRQYGVAQALRALVRISEHEWTEDEKAQLFEASLAVSVHLQPPVKSEADAE